MKAPTEGWREVVGGVCWSAFLPGAHGKHLLQVQHHAGWVLQVLLPQIREATHSGAIDDAVIS